MAANEKVGPKLRVSIPRKIAARTKAETAEVKAAETLALLQEAARKERNEAGSRQAGRHA